MRGRIHDLHFAPVIRKFLAAFQAHDVCASNRCGWSTTRTAGRNRKAVILMPATEQQVYQTHSNTPWRITAKEAFTRLFSKSSFSLVTPLDSGELKLVP